jgi:DNA-binding beta-propeller fold protein YncE
MHSPRNRAARLALITALLALPVVAWAAVRASAPAPVWPAAPDPARVRWLASMSSDREPGAKRALLSRLRDVVTGERGRVLLRPVGLCAGDDGSLLVSDPGSSTVYELRTGEKALRVFTSRRLVTPTGLARLANGDVWVADADRGVLVRFDARGGYQSEAGAGTLARPTGLAYDRMRDRLYVADAQAHHVAVFDGAGKPLGVFGKRGTAPGEFNFPLDVKVAANGELLVCDAMNFRIQRLTSDGQPISAFGSAGDSHGSFARPKGVALDGEGHVYVVDALHDAVQIFDAQGRLLLVVGGRGAAAGRFNLPAAIAIDASDHIYVADAANHRVQVFEYLREGSAR